MKRGIVFDGIMQWNWIRWKYELLGTKNFW